MDQIDVMEKGRDQLMPHGSASRPHVCLTRLSHSNEKLLENHMVVSSEQLPRLFIRPAPPCRTYHKQRLKSLGACHD